MTPDYAVQLGRETLVTTLWLVAPILLAATVVSLLISIAQVMTSIQEITVATVPRLAVVAVATFVLLPWMIQKMMSFTVQLFADFHRCLG
jgi:flagellar biosynthetic protein FliQ